MTNIASADFGRSQGGLPSLAEGSPRATAATPGQPDMWVLVFVEALTFSAYFVVYVVCWALQPKLYLQSQAQLSLPLGAANTLMLVTSSWSMARCVAQARVGNYQGALWNVWLTILLGLVYFIAKLYEWSTRIHDGLYFSTNQFFSFYYFLTGMHLLHVLVGFIVLGVVVYQLSSPARRSQEIIETGATYWHMVDFLWIFIFALLYVMR
jgi:nitric oxide reductase NorE protein